MGMSTIQIYSDADADMPAVSMADEAVSIGPPQAARSYLNREVIIEAARTTGADAVHPGYGFLAEDAEFADAVERAGLRFVGPAAETIRQMGDKARARTLALQAGVPTVPGSAGPIDSVEAGLAIAGEIGFPVMIKAVGGGGGRGIRTVANPEEFSHQAPQARAEARAAFGDDALYIEKVIDNASHIEVQILGDSEHAIHFFERECSLQRRRQKVWEEAPSVNLSEELRTDLCAAAVKLAQEVGYRGAGTVEFLCDKQAGRYYFIEMNTRIQVEHPVTEMVTGFDLVREMLSIAAGRPLEISQQDIATRGHSIEVRLNAEDPARNFLPFPGLVESLTIPSGPGVRFDGAIYPGYTIPPFYDSLLGKLIVWDSDREAALARLARALDEFRLVGVSTTSSLFRRLVDEEDIRGGRFDTGWLETWLQEAYPEAESP
jgi:acetyl-CoA carboxylase biotin carboxylase subunit